MYEITVFDSSNYQVAIFLTSETSIGVNGGESFPATGYIDVRAYQNSNYACYTRLNFSRLSDPNRASSGSPDRSVTVAYADGPYYSPASGCPAIGTIYFYNFAPNSNITTNGSYTGQECGTGTPVNGTTNSVVGTTDSNGYLAYSWFSNEITGTGTYSAIYFDGQGNSVTLNWNH